MLSAGDVLTEPPTTLGPKPVCRRRVRSLQATPRSAFAFATAVTADVPELSLAMYGMASVVGFSRVLTGVHFPSDVIGGGVLGLVIGTAVREASFRALPRPTCSPSGISADNRRRRPGGNG